MFGKKKSKEEEDQEFIKEIFDNVEWGKNYACVYGYHHVPIEFLEMMHNQGFKLVSNSTEVFYWSKH